MTKAQENAMYLEKLDGEIEETFYRKHIKEWREDQNRFQEQIKVHQKADENYIEQGFCLSRSPGMPMSFSRAKTNRSGQS